MYKIKISELDRMWAAIAQISELYLPIEKAGAVNFAPWEQGACVDICTLKTVKSPKDIFFPQSETLYNCARTDGRLTVSAEQLCDKPFVVFGVRPCDVQGIAVLDRVFLSDPVDTFYAARRANGTIVSVACGEPEESCFCGTFGIDCAEPEADVSCWKAAEYLYFKPATEKGEVLMSALTDLLESEADESVVESEKARIRSIYAQLPNATLDLAGWDGKATAQRFDSPLWDHLYKPCLACGTCTFVCPTCQCYDIKDYDTGNGVQRYRCWDSCMYSDFTMMAHGNNRTSQMQRFRQRFMHKLVYFPANNGGVYSCVGCGRCVDSCPASLNIVKVIKAFAKEGE